MTHSHGWACSAFPTTASTSSLPSRPIRQVSTPTPCSANLVSPVSIASANGSGSHGPGTRYGSSPMTRTRGEAAVSTSARYSSTGDGAGPGRPRSSPGRRGRCPVHGAGIAPGAGVCAGRASRRGPGLIPGHRPASRHLADLLRLGRLPDDVPITTDQRAQSDIDAVRDAAAAALAADHMRRAERHLLEGLRLLTPLRDVAILGIAIAALAAVEVTRAPRRALVLAAAAAARDGAGGRYAAQLPPPSMSRRGTAQGSAR